MFARRVITRTTAKARRWNATAAEPAAASPPQEDWDLEKKINERALFPSQIVEQLDRFIVGQAAAKRAVAISLRNRWRSTNIKDKELRADIHPKNILMVGPTGVGKTEISRRMAKLTDAPFVKVEATKFTEVGFKGRDVETIIEDLHIAAVQRAKKLAKTRHQAEAREAAIQIVLNKLCPDNQELEKYRELLEKGELDDKEIDFTISAEEKKEQPKKPRLEGGEGDDNLQGVFIFSYDMKGKDEKGKTKKMHTKIKDALPLIENDVLEKLIDQKQIAKDAVALAENHGVVFIDEIDKVVTPKTNKHADASAEGVQQDLLPLIEGSTVTLKDGGAIRTDNILFICSGAFHVSKPSDMIAELQGRLPVRVELQALTENDFYRILTEPVYNIIRQNVELMKTEEVDLVFTEEAKREIAHMTTRINGEMQNIGARRLTTVVEKIIEDISFEADDYKGKSVTIDTDYVQKKVAELRKDVKNPAQSIL